MARLSIIFMLAILTGCDSIGEDPSDDTGPPLTVEEPGNNDSESIQKPAVAPQHSLPINGAVDQPIPVTFSWSPVEGASQYNLYAYRTVVSGGRVTESAFVKLDANYNSACFAKCRLDTNHYTTGSDYPSSWNGETVYWRVRALNRSGNGPWSATHTFQLRK
jgi:hypothetical protein